MGISHPIKHGHINDRESLPHMAPMEVNMVSEPHMPKPKVQDTKKWAKWKKIEQNTSSVVEDSNCGEGVGWKKKPLNA